MSSRYVLHRNCKGNYHFTLITHSGQVLLTSGVYTDKERALRAILSARTLAHHIRNYQIFTEEDGESFFFIRSKKGEVLAESETFPDVERLRNGINLVKGNTRGARLEDQTVPYRLRQSRRGKGVRSRRA